MHPNKEVYSILWYRVQRGYRAALALVCLLAGHQDRIVHFYYWRGDRYSTLRCTRCWSTYLLEM